MIEFCPGGAVDATMLGECSARCWALLRARGDAHKVSPAFWHIFRSSLWADGKRGCPSFPSYCFSPMTLPIFILGAEGVAALGCFLSYFDVLL